MKKRTLAVFSIQYFEYWLGNFKLDKSFKPLLRIFEGKLRSAELMAKRKGLDFIVEDETTATDAGLNKIVKGSKTREKYRKKFW